MLLPLLPPLLQRYVTGQSTDPGEEFVFVQYRGHTLQGSYDGGFVYARKPFLPKTALSKVARVARVSLVRKPLCDLVLELSFSVLFSGYSVCVCVCWLIDGLFCFLLFAGGTSRLLRCNGGMYVDACSPIHFASGRCVRVENFIKAAPCKCDRTQVGLPLPPPSPLNKKRTRLLVFGKRVTTP